MSEVVRKVAVLKLYAGFPRGGWGYIPYFKNCDFYVSVINCCPKQYRSFNCLSWHVDKRTIKNVFKAAGLIEDKDGILSRQWKMYECPVLPLQYQDWNTKYDRNLIYAPVLADEMLGIPDSEEEGKNKTIKDWMVIITGNDGFIRYVFASEPCECFVPYPDFRNSICGRNEYKELTEELFASLLAHGFHKHVFNDLGFRDLEPHHSFYGRYIRMISRKRRRDFFRRIFHVGRN